MLALQLLQAHRLSKAGRRRTCLLFPTLASLSRTGGLSVEPNPGGVVELEQVAGMLGARGRVECQQPSI